VRIAEVRMKTRVKDESPTIVFNEVRRDRKPNAPLLSFNEVRHVPFKPATTESSYTHDVFFSIRVL
jgi:hypothetical protein